MSIFAKSVQEENENYTENVENEELDTENEKTLFSQILFRDMSPIPKLRKRGGNRDEDGRETPLLIKVNATLKCINTTHNGDFTFLQAKIRSVNFSTFLLKHTLISPLLSSLLPSYPILSYPVLSSLLFSYTFLLTILSPLILF
jgi:hypothetical protein